MTCFHSCTLFKQSCSVQSNSSANSSEVRCRWSQSLGALEPQESHTAFWIYNRVTQSLSKTLFSGGNRVGFVQLQAGVPTSLDPSLQGMLTSWWAWTVMLACFMRAKVDVFPLLLTPKGCAAMVGKGGWPDLPVYLTSFHPSLGFKPNLGSNKNYCNGSGAMNLPLIVCSLCSFASHSSYSFCLFPPHLLFHLHIFLCLTSSAHRCCSIAHVAVPLRGLTWSSAPIFCLSPNTAAMT